MRMSSEKESKGDPIEAQYAFKPKVVWWPNATIFIILQVGAFYGLYLSLNANFISILWAIFLTVVGVQATTITAHRLYSHRAFKATSTLRLLLVMLYTIQAHGSCFNWARYHRLHHKHSDTDADPHNSNRGFFFSHVGWLMITRHPLVPEKMRTIDVTDLKEDKILMFQKKYVYQLFFLLSILIPVGVPMYFWQETLLNSFFICFVARYTIGFHCVVSINSVAHMYGYKPFDKSIEPAESTFVSIVTGGEGWHNYHHSFPWDYRAAELGSKFNLSRHLIDLFAYLNMAYDLRVTSNEIIKAKSIRSGDGSHHEFGNKSRQ